MIRQLEYSTPVAQRNIGLKSSETHHKDISDISKESIISVFKEQASFKRRVLLEETPDVSDEAIVTNLKVDFTKQRNSNIYIYIWMHT